MLPNRLVRLTILPRPFSISGSRARAQPHGADNIHLEDLGPGLGRLGPAHGRARIEQPGTVEQQVERRRADARRQAIDQFGIGQVQGDPAGVAAEIGESVRACALRPRPSSRAGRSS